MPLKVLDISIEQAMSAFGRPGPGSLEAVTKGTAYGLYNFTVDDLGRVTTRLPVEIAEAGIDRETGHSNGDGQLVTLRATWNCFLRSGHEKSLGALATYCRAMNLLASKEPFPHPPLLCGRDMSILDGKHRLFAAYEFGLARTKLGQAFGLYVYWSPDRTG